MVPTRSMLRLQACFAKIAGQFIRYSKGVIVKKLLSGLVLFLFASGSAFASGMYAAIDVGQGTIKDACTNTPAGTSGCTDKATATRIGIGYQLPLEILAVEADYGNFGKASATVGGVAGDLKASGFQVSAIASLPVVPEAVSLFGKVGLANIKTTNSFAGSDTNNNLTFGVGAAFTLLPVVDLRVQYEDFGSIGGTNSTGLTKYKLNMLSAGITYKF